MPLAKARRLRHLAVDKGLLREVKAIQNMLDALVVCRVSWQTHTMLLPERQAHIV